MQENSVEKNEVDLPVHQEQAAAENIFDSFREEELPVQEPQTEIAAVEPVIEEIPSATARYQDKIAALYKQPNVKIFNPAAVQFQNSHTVYQKFHFSQHTRIGSGSYCQVFQAGLRNNFSEKLAQFEKDKQNPIVEGQSIEEIQARNREELRKTIHSGPKKLPFKNEFALKEMDNDKGEKGMLSHHAVKEILTLRKLNHPHIASAQNVHWNHNLSDMSRYEPTKKHFKMFIEMQKARHDLQELTLYNETKTKLKPREVKCVLKQIAQGLCYLHSEKQIIHRDIKPPNILWYEKGIIKITDFNHAIELDKLVEMKFKGQCGTPWFKAPELLLDMQYSYGVDVWALGCVFQYMLTGDFIFRFDASHQAIPRQDENTKRKQHLIAIFKQLGKPNDTIWPGIERQEKFLQIECPDCPSQLRKYMKDRGVTDPAALALLEKMFTYDPDQRIKIKQILEDPYLNDPQEMPCLPEQLPKIQNIHDFRKNQKKNVQEQQNINPKKRTFNNYAQNNKPKNNNNNNNPNQKKPRLGGQSQQKYQPQQNFNFENQKKNNPRTFPKNEKPNKGGKNNYQKPNAIKSMVLAEEQTVKKVQFMELAADDKQGSPLSLHKSQSYPYQSKTPKPSKYGVKFNLDNDISQFDLKNPQQQQPIPKYERRYSFNNKNSKNFNNYSRQNDDFDHYPRKRLQSFEYNSNNKNHRKHFNNNNGLPQILEEQLPPYIPEMDEDFYQGPYKSRKNSTVKQVQNINYQ